MRVTSTVSWRAPRRYRVRAFAMSLVLATGVVALPAREARTSDDDPGALRRPSASRVVRYGPRRAAPTRVDVSGSPTAAPALRAVALAAPQAVVDDRTLAGHLMRRIGFGPRSADVDKILALGRAAYIEQQLNPLLIDDSVAEAKLSPETTDFYDDYSWQVRWYTRIRYTKRQLLEKMTLIWHEHFSVSNAKVGSGCWMHHHEQLLRANALGGFRALLRKVTKDQAMLIWLDNDFNRGLDSRGSSIPPNENYAREFLQLLAVGTTMLNLDGTPQTNAQGVPIPAYTEDDVKAISRALTGWYVDWSENPDGSTACTAQAKFAPWIHDPTNKVLFAGKPWGGTITGSTTAAGGKGELDQVLNVVMQHPSMAPFVAKTLIMKLSSETPNPGFVRTVATVFRDTGGDLRATVRAILTHPKFTSSQNVRTMYKTPIEQFMGALRGLEGATEGDALHFWTFQAGHELYYPPSVFSFYPPGNKGALVNNGLVMARDNVADDFVDGRTDTFFDPAALRTKYGLTTATSIVTFLEDVLLTAPLDPAVRNELMGYLNGRTSDQAIEGAVWLILTSPDFQRN